MPNDIYLGPIDGISESFAQSAPARPTEKAETAYRALRAGEIATLVKNDNSAEDWDEIHVSQSFSPDLIVGCEFYGEVYLGDLEPLFICHHDLRLPVGIRI